MRDLAARASEQRDTQQGDERIDTTLDREREEGELEALLLLAVGLLVDIFLEHREVREGEEDARAREEERDFLGDAHGSNVEMSTLGYPYA